MKKLIFTISAILLFCTYSFSQANITTTEEEYNYVTIGYPQAIEAGYDVKQGYTVKDFGNWGYKGDDFTFKAFYRHGVYTPIAILVIYTNTFTKSSPEYYCIPTMNALVLWQKMLQRVTSDFIAQAKYEAFTYALMQLASKNMLAH